MPLHSTHDVSYKDLTSWGILSKATKPDKESWKIGVSEVGRRELHKVPMYKNFATEDKKGIDDSVCKNWLLKYMHYEKFTDSRWLFSPRSDV